MPWSGVQAFTGESLLPVQPQRAWKSSVVAINVTAMISKFPCGSFLRKKIIRLLSVWTHFKVFGHTWDIRVHHQVCKISSASSTFRFRLLPLISLPVAAPPVLVAQCERAAWVANESSLSETNFFSAKDSDKLKKQLTPSHPLHSSQPLPWSPEGWNILKYLETDSIALAALCHLVSVPSPAWLAS